MAKAKKEKTQKSEVSLTKKVWNMANVLSSAGVGFTDYITQLTYILFLKMDNEREEIIGIPSTLPEGCRWNDLIKDKNGKEIIGEDLINKYEKILPNDNFSFTFLSSQVAVELSATGSSNDLAVFECSRFGKTISSLSLSGDKSRLQLIQNSLCILFMV